MSNTEKKKKVDNSHLPRPTDEELIHLYTVEQKSLREIEAACNITIEGARYRLGKLGIEMRPWKKEVSEKKLRKLYETEKRSIAEVGEILKIDSATVRKRLETFGIEIRAHTPTTPRRRTSDSRTITIPKSELVRLHEEEGKTQEEIAEIFGCSQAQISDLMIEYGINPGRGKGNYKKRGKSPETPDV